MKRCIIAICLILMAQSCVRKYASYSDMDCIGNAEAKFIPMEQALENLAAFVAETGMDQTRTGEPKQIKSIDAYRGEATRSGQDLPQAYVVNYENNGGFAILGANTDFFPIVAVTENGQIDAETLLVEDESGVVDKVFLAEYLKASINTRISDYSDIFDGTRSGSRTTVLPLFNSNYNFEQTHSYCHDDDGNFVICGCSATAIAMIVAYNQSPYMSVTTANSVERIDYSYVDSLDGIGHLFRIHDNGVKIAGIYINQDDYYLERNYRHDTDNLDSLIAGTPLADLINEYPLGYGLPGEQNYCRHFEDMLPYYRTRSLLQAALFYRIDGDAGFESTSASANEMMSCLEVMNYLNVSKRSAYSINNNMLNDIESMLVDGKPVLMGGTPVLSNKGHAWVVDGEAVIRIEQTFALHFNWGWGGRCNGYFAPASSIHSNAGLAYDSISTDNSVNRNFGHFTTIIYDLPSYTYTLGNPVYIYYRYAFNPEN